MDINEESYERKNEKEGNIVYITIGKNEVEGILYDIYKSIYHIPDKEVREDLIRSYNDSNLPIPDCKFYKVILPFNKSFGYFPSIIVNSSKELNIDDFY